MRVLAATSARNRWEVFIGECLKIHPRAICDRRPNLGGWRRSVEVAVEVLVVAGDFGRAAPWENPTRAAPNFYETQTLLGGSATGLQWPVRADGECSIDAAGVALPIFYRD